MLAHFEQQFEILSEKEGALKSMREGAWKQLQEVGLPTQKTEAFRYVPLDLLYELLKTDAALNDRSDVKGYVTFVDGEYQALDLGSKIVARPLCDALKQYGQIAAFDQFKEAAPFAMMNAALHEGAAFLYVPAGVKLEKPLKVVHRFSQKGYGFPRIHLVVGRGSSVQIEEHFNGGEGAVCVPHVQVYIEEGASLSWREHIENPKWHVGSKRFELKKGAKIDLCSFTRGGESVWQDVRVDLLEEEANADLRALSVLKESAQSHIHYHVRHLAPGAVSNQTVKSVVYDRAKHRFEGKIEVESIAQQTESYQLNHNLLLSDLASAYSKPNLEIFADDVKASHGATVGQLDSEQLFYLKARGMDDFRAKELLIHAFCADLLVDAPKGFLEGFGDDAKMAR